MNSLQFIWQKRLAPFIPGFLDRHLTFHNRSSLEFELCGDCSVPNPSPTDTQQANNHKQMPNYPDSHSDAYRQENRRNRSASLRPYKYTLRTLRLCVRFTATALRD